MLSKIIHHLRAGLIHSSKKHVIVYPEGWNPLIQEASLALQNDGVLEPLLVFRTRSEVPHNWSTPFIVMPEANQEAMAKQLVKLRKGKTNLKQARELLQKANYFAAMLVYLGQADAYLGGIEFTTADTLRPGLQIIKTTAETKLASSATLLAKGDEFYVFADCALNIDPNAEQLAMITRQVVSFTQQVLEVSTPKTALLSYSTNGSGKGPAVAKVREAYQLLQQSGYKDTTYFGDLQFDAALSPQVLAKKLPTLGWKEPAKICIFPTLEAGNIGYKIAQRLGGFAAVGPILLGMQKPINDLSRGADATEIYATSIVTAKQAGANFVQDTDEVE